MRKYLTILAAGAGAAALFGGVSASQIPESPEDDGPPRAERHGNDMHGRRHGRHGRMMGMRMLEAADANGDNSVTRQEADALREEMFVWLDRNGDDVLNIDDRSPVERRLAAARADRSDAEEDDGRGRHRRGRGGHMAELDQDEDGAISRDEFMSHETGLFDRFDADGDDVVTPDELDAMVEGRRERRESRRFWWRE